MKFDLESAVNEASKEWESTYAAKLEKLLAKRPVKVELDLNTKSLDNLDEVKRRLAEVKLEPVTAENRTAIKDLVRELKELAKIMEKIEKFKGIEIPELQQAKAAKARKETEQADAKLALQQERARQSNERLILTQQKAERQAKGLSSAYHSQGSYLSRLVKRMAVYASFAQIGNFLTQIREVTAEFELQRVSLGVVIQDQNRANQLFSEIKSFALTSPLKILDLTKYTKQVAAYGIETDKLFNTTKMLADISVGLGVGMDRLTLFLGQVYATGYLRASEVRQATEAGIPLVDKLAKKLTETSGKLVTTADVMDLISKRAISFEQVEEVFKDMTSEGGEFYNMQIKQSQTLFGMWSKLGDAAAIMYDEIGNTAEVNGIMKTSIKLLETLFRNWETAANIVGSLAVAVGVYAVGLKNASIAAKALSVAEAENLVLQKRKIITTPILIEFFSSQNIARKLSIVLTRAHTTASIEAATATNILSKAFWKLTAAMLSNPWLALAALFVGASIAIWNFISRAETASKRIEKLNNSAAALNNLNNTTQPLIDTYNELIDKTDRTAEEQRKLSQVTHELAKQYPGAVNAIGDFGDSIDLITEKLNRLHQAERNARMDNVQNELDKTKAKIQKTERQITELQEVLARGSRTTTSYQGHGYFTTEEVLNDADRAKILEQIETLCITLSELRGAYTETHDLLEAMQNGTTVEQLNIDRFGAWKKELRTFRVEVENGLNVQLFDDSTLNQFKSLDEAMKQTAQKYKENTELVERYRKALAEMSATDESRARVEQDMAEAQAEADASLSALTRFGYKPSDFENGRSGDSQSDPRLGILQEMLSTLKNVNKEYEELNNKVGETKAISQAQAKYASTFRYLQSLADKYHFDLPELAVPKDSDSLKRYYEAIKEAMKKLPKSEKAVLSIETDIADLDMNAMQKRVEIQIERLKDKIAQTKTAKEFYEKILGLTGDVELSARVSVQLYGTDGRDLKAQTKEIFKRTFATLATDSASISNIISEIIDRGAYEELAKYISYLPKQQQQAASELVKNQQQLSAKQYEQWVKDLSKAKSFAEKRIELSRTTATQIAAIEEKISALNPNAENYDQQKAALEQLIEGYEQKERKDAANIEYDMFKDMPIYVQMFENLDNASKSMLANMLKLLKKNKEAWGEFLTPTQLKEMQSRMEEVESQLASRNPIKSLSKAFKDLRELRKGGSRENYDKAATDAMQAEMSAMSKWIDADKAYQDALKANGNDTENEVVKAAKAVADSAKQEYDAAHKTSETAQEQANAWKLVLIAINNVNAAIDKYQASINNALNVISATMEVFGADAIDLEFFNQMQNGFNQVLDGAQSAATAYGQFATGQYLQGAMSSVSAITSIASGISNLFTAGKVRKANKEIKRQKELLEQLDYTYSRLQASADKLFGGDYLNNYNQQLENLQAQQTAYLKQAEAERSKGKKADEEAIKGYEEQAQSTADKIKELQDDLVAHFTGSTKTDVARQMAQSWIDARASMSDTFAAIKGDYADLIKNMIVEGAAARVIENALNPLWESMEERLNKDDSQGAIDALVNGMDDALTQANNGMETLWQALESRGYDMKQLISDTDSEGSGIAKNISNATSEEINTLTAVGNTLMYYVSPIPRMDENLAIIRSIIENGGSAVGASSNSGWTDWQQQAMENYTAIARNTADTVIECRRAAEACEKLSKAVEVKGGKMVVRTSLN